MPHDELIGRPTAVQRLLDLRSTLEVEATEPAPVDRIAGRVLAERVTAETDSPSRSIATMDGYAIDATDGYPLKVVAEVFPEDDPPAVGDGEAVAIATGAPLPEGTNAVVKREDCELEGDRVTGPAVSPGTYAYERGSNVSAGETLYEAGERLGPRESILLADLGYEEISVRPRYSVGLLATGTEIHEGRSKDLDSPMLAGLVREWSHEPTIEGSVPDTFERVRDRIDELAACHDVVITTGGTSVGHKDYVIRALAELGTVSFHGVRIRPGKPIAAARVPDRDAVALAIPGKPVGAYTIAIAVARALFTGEGTLPGAREATVARSVGIPREGFEYWIPVTVSEGEAMPLGHADSPLSVYTETFDPSVLSSSTRAVRADGVVITETGLEAGEPVAVRPYEHFT